MAEVTLQASQRTDTGKQAAKQVRGGGLVPGVLYGLDDAPEPVAVNGRELLDMLHKFGRNVVVNLAVGSAGDKIKSFIYEIQHDPLSGSISHVDFKRISLKEKIHITVPVHLEGVPAGVKNEGGIVEHITHTVNVSCLPTAIPETITVDISELHLHDALHVKDLPAEGFEILDDADMTVVHVIAPKVILSAEGEEGEEGAMGTAEPEVIGKAEPEE